jgi:hypothetical protein
LPPHTFHFFITEVLALYEEIYCIMSFLLQLTCKTRGLLRRQIF